MTETRFDFDLPVKTDRRTPRAIAYLLVFAGCFVYCWGVYQLHLEKAGDRKPLPLPQPQQPERQSDSILLVRRSERTYHLFAARDRHFVRQKHD